MDIQLGRARSEKKSCPALLMQGEVKVSDDPLIKGAQYGVDILRAVNALDLVRE